MALYLISQYFILGKDEEKGESGKMMTEVGRKVWKRCFPDRLAGSRLFWILIILFLVSGCAGRIEVTDRPEPVPIPEKTEIERVGYTIQIGAFSNLENAVRLTEVLDDQGLDAYYFRHESSLYKVRFGDFTTKEEALREAGGLASNAIIEGYYIVSPEDYALAKEGKDNPLNLRRDIVATAESFLGLPYRWGGSSPDKGFDCSGLAMAVYRLNGLRLPRSSRSQYRAGRPIDRGELEEGDLVFFATSGGRRVSHVGIYMGDDRFIHAPGRGKRIKTGSLSNGYFRVRYVGAKRYI